MIFQLWFLLLFLQITHQTNIEYHDGPSPEHAHILQKCRFLGSGDCCVPVDLIPPNSNRLRFRPYKIVFEYFSKNALYVFANADDKSACNGPSVDGYKDPAAQSYVKDFVAKSDQKFSGALFTEDGGLVRVGQIRYPWSITYGNVLYYQVPSNPLFYVDASRRYFLRAIVQFRRSITLSI